MSIETEIKKLTAAINRQCDILEAQGSGGGLAVCDGSAGQPVAIPATVIEQPAQPQPDVLQQQAAQIAAQQLAAQQQPVQQQPVQQQPVQQQPVQQQPVQQQPVQPIAAVQQPAATTGAITLDDESINQFLIERSAQIPNGIPRIKELLLAHGGAAISQVPQANRPALVAAIGALV